MGTFGMEFEERLLVGAMCGESFESELQTIGVLREDELVFLLGLELCSQT